MSCYCGLGVGKALGWAICGKRLGVSLIPFVLENSATSCDNNLLYETKLCK
jgi:hypothetical protein